MHTVRRQRHGNGLHRPRGPAELTAIVGPVTIRRVTGGTGATATGVFSGLAYVSNTNTPFGGGISTNMYSASGSAPGGSVSWQTTH